MRFKTFFIRLKSWEYWPFHYVYGPVYFYWFWLCLRARSFFFFNAANPTIQNGGFLMESKKQIYDLLPPGTYPATCLVKPGQLLPAVQQVLGQTGLQYPIIAKPDIGMRGLGVALLQTPANLARYHAATKVDYLLQQYVSYPREAGIFYYRLPGAAQGTITGIVEKVFLKVTGDGVRTIRQLVEQEDRFVLQLPALQAMLGGRLDSILPPGEDQLLVPFGNHSRGALFLDHTHLTTPQLTEVIDRLCSQVDGFYFGRLDIRYQQWDELCQGRHFSVIELNGAGSEPAHMYDPRHSLLFGWKEIIRHWNLLYRVSMMNRQAGVPFMTTSQGLQMFKDNKKQVKLLTQ